MVVRICFVPGSVRKEFKIQRAEKGGFFFSLTVTSAQERANFVQPVRRSLCVRWLAFKTLLRYPMQKWR